MIKIMNLLNAIKNETVIENFVIQLPIVESEIKNLFVKIKQCDDLIESQKYFEILQKIVEALEGPVFALRVNISDQLWKFMKDFDRIDRPDAREYFFYQIKNDLYYF